jgi:ribonuclease R
MREKKSKKNLQPEKREASAPHHIVSYIDNLKADIAAFFDLNSEHAFRPFDVHDHFGVHDKKVRVLFNEILHELEQDGKLIYNKNGTYASVPQKDKPHALIGRVDRVNKGFAFVIIEGREDDIYVDLELLNGAWDGDIVQIQPLSRNTRNLRSRGDSGRNRTEGRVTEIVERSNAEIVGIIEINPRFAVVQPDSKKLYDPIFLEPDEVGEAHHGDKVIVKVKEWPTRRSQAEGEIVSVLGKAGNNDVEMHAILAEFGLPYHFPEIVEAERRKFLIKLPKRILPNVAISGTC